MGKGSIGFGCLGPILHPITLICICQRQPILYALNIFLIPSNIPPASPNARQPVNVLPKFKKKLDHYSKKWKCLRFCTQQNCFFFQATMLKKRKHKIKRRNTEPTVNHPLVLATGSAVGPESVGACSSYGAHAAESIPEHPINLADICDSPTHATAVWN